MSVVESAREQSSRNVPSALDLLERFGLVALLVVVVVVFTVDPSTSGTFPTSANVDNLLGNRSVLALVALAAIVPLICGQFDLSVGAVMGFTSVLCAHMVSAWSVPTLPAILLTITVGATLGAINGVLVARVRLNSLITTLAMATVLGGLSLALTSTPIVSGIPNSLVSFGTGKTLGVPRTFLLVAVIAAILLYVLERTPYGRLLRAVGSNAQASRLVGLGVDRIILSSFVLSGALSGAAGVVQLARSGSGDPSVGASFTLPAIAAAFLGATSIRPGRFNVLGTLVAIAFLAATVSGLTISGIESWIQDVVNGAALLIGIAASAIIARQRGRAA